MMALIAVITCMADTTIDANHPYAYGANTGWINALGNVTHGAVIGQAYCTGYVYSANCGWICLGSGPTNGWQYSNLLDSDWGVNHDGAGNLSGYAYGANIGWITFEQTHGQPHVDLLTANLGGYAWSANTGWISLSNAQAYVRTETIDAGPDSDTDGIPDAWEYGYTNVLTVLADGGADSDGDGISDVDEYGTDTDPFDANDYLWVTLDKAGGTTNTLSWPTRPTRNYRLQSTTNLVSIEWTISDVGLLHDETGTLTVQDEPVTNSPVRFYRVNAVLPLE